MKQKRNLIKDLNAELKTDFKEISKELLKSKNGYYLDRGKVKGLTIRGLKMEVLPKSLSLFLDLEELYLDDNKLVSLREMSDLKNLTILSLSGNEIKDLSGIINLENIEDLGIEMNGLIDLTQISNLKNLRKLRLSNNLLENPKSLNNLSMLTDLQLWNCGLKNFDFISKLKKLRFLDLSENSLTEIGFVSGLRELEVLILNENQISDISPIMSLHNLVELDISQNRISDLKAIAELVNLKELYATSNAIKNLFALGKLANLVSLSISDNVIEDISVLSELRNLEELYIGINKIHDLSPVANLKRIKELDVWDNNINDISALSDLHMLFNLDLSLNKISDISTLSNLKLLANLELMNNEISDISPLESLEVLRNLNLSENEISNIDSLKELSHLETLNLKDNRVSQFPEWLLNSSLEITYRNTSFQRFEGCNLYGNPIENVPVELFYLGKNAIKDYLKSLEGGAEPINEIKVILLGEGAAGKTSLMNFLQGKPYKKNQSQTHGINLGDCIQKTGVTMKVWDFGGQDIMHHTHQFFLTKKSVYILVLNARENTDTEKWLKLIQVFGGDSPVIIVTNKIDENPSDHENIKYLNTKYPNIKNRYARISCEKNIGLDIFTDILTETISELLQVRTLWGNSWLQVKKELEEMRSGESLKDYIHFDRYDEICSKYDVPETHRETLINWLHQLGVITYFSDVNLSETNVINPSWLTEAFYSIINSEVVAGNYGRFNIASLVYILDTRRYPKQKYQFLLGLMIKFELCYQIDNANYLIPDLLNKEEPNFDFDIKSSLKFKYRYTNLLPKAILPKFMVRRHQQILEEKKWRTGLLITDPYFNSRGLIRIDEEDKEISIYVTGEEKRGYLASIISDIENINTIYEGLEYDKLIPCCCGDCKMTEKPYYFKYEVLMNLKQKKRITHVCEESLDDVNINELLGALITREELENEITDLVGRGTFQTKKCLIEGNVEGFINTIKSLFSSVSYLLFEKSEKAYHTPFFILLRSIFLSNARADEIQTKGRADIIITLDKFVYILELKLDGEIEEAMAQIHLNKYYEPYMLDGKKIILIAINFSSKERNIESFVTEYI